jgi:hypothetical protein
LLNKCIPKKRIKIKNNTNKPWLTTGLKISCKHKRLLRILNTNVDDPILKNNYKQYEKTLKKAIIISKKQQNIHKMKKSNNTVKEMWKIVKEHTNKQNTKEKKNLKLHVGNTYTENPREISNKFNRFFSLVGDSQLPVPTGRPILNPSVNSMYLGQVTPQEIYKSIRNLKNKKSFGHDELPPFLIRKCAEKLAPVLCFLINQSFIEGMMPISLKLSVIKPVHKKGDQKDCSNYRPVALLPTFSKIFEGAMSVRLYSYCEKFNIFNECQNGFRKKRSTSLSVYKYIQEILNIINIKKYAIGMLLDMSKAYDRVLYNILLRKLWDIGVRGLAYTWFESYLSDRVQYVEIEHYDQNTRNIIKVKSEKISVTKSIPQGSVLGCILFLLYINDLPNIIHTPCALFADDIAIVIPCTGNVNLTENINNTLLEIDRWLSDHNLTLNYSKTKLMQFHPYQKQPLQINYTFKNVPIECVTSYMLLGINIDSNINWKNHVKKISAKLSRFTYALYELKKVTNKEAALSAYYAYANAWLQYGIILWGNCIDAEKLFRLQKRCIRIIVNIDQFSSCRPYFIKEKILPLTCIYILQICIFVSNNLHLFPQYTRPINLRQRNKLAPPISTLKLVHSGPFAMAVKIYNKIPKYIQDETKETLFRKSLKEYLIKKCYYTLQEFLDE